MVLEIVWQLIHCIHSLSDLHNVSKRPFSVTIQYDHSVVIYNAFSRNVDLKQLKHEAEFFGVQPLGERGSVCIGGGVFSL